VLSFQFADGTDVAKEQETPPRTQFIFKFARFLTTRFLGPRNAPRVGRPPRLDEAVDAL